MKILIEWCLSKGVLMNLIFVGVLLFGLVVAIPGIPVERYPNIEFGQVVISTAYLGASAEEVERLVTQELEDSLRGMEDVEYISCTSRTGSSSIIAKFQDDTNYEKLYNELRIRILSVQNRLPVLNGKPLSPRFNYINVDEWLPVIQYNLSSKHKEHTLSLRSLTLLAKELQLELENIPGVKNINLIGEANEEYIVALDPKRLESLGLTLAEVAQALRQQGQALPAGSIRTHDGRRVIRVDERWVQREDLLNTVLRVDGTGSVLYLKDCIVHQATRIQRMDGGVISNVNGKDVVACKVLKDSSANAKTIRGLADQVIETFLYKHRDKNLTITPTLDSTRKIDDGLGVLANSLVMALILVMLVLFLFLAKVPLWAHGVAVLLSSAGVAVALEGDGWLRLTALVILGVYIFTFCRPAILTTSGIAFSFVGSVAFFYITGQSLNEITLLGFVITCGIIVDDAIVVLENIQRHREEGQALWPAVIDGTAEVFWPVTSATLTSIAAFLPMLLMTGSTGEFFALIPIAVSVALGISLLECLCILPIHILDLEKLLPSKHTTPKPMEDEEHLPFVIRIYRKALDISLKHAWLSFVMIACLVVLSIAILYQSSTAPLEGKKPLLKLAFFPDDTSIINVTLRMPSNTALATTDKMMRSICTDLEALGPKQIANATGLSGITVDSSYRNILGEHLGLVMAELPVKSERSFENANAHILKIRKLLENRYEKDGVELEVSAQKDGPPTGAPLHVRVTGINDPVVEKLASDLKAFLLEQSHDDNPLSGYVDIRSDRDVTETRLNCTVLSSEAALLGLSQGQVQQYVAMAVDGAYVGDYRRSDKDIPVKIRIFREGQSDLNDLLNLPIVRHSNGSNLRFREMGSVQEQKQAADLVRRDFQRTINITANKLEEAKLSPAQVPELIHRWYKDRLTQYPGATLAFGGEAESTARSYNSLKIAFAVAAFLIYAILAVQFNSYIQPLLIMSNILFSFTGVVIMMGCLGALSIYLPEGVVRPERSLFTVQSFIAIIGLTGLVVNDSIVLIDFINQKRALGMELNDALRLSSIQRARPILMTTCTTIAGLLPLAIGLPEFSITWGPFATCFVAGLSVSTFMTLLIIPGLYRSLDRVSSFCLTFWPKLHNL